MRGHTNRLDDRKQRKKKSMRNLAVIAAVFIILSAFHLLFSRDFLSSFSSAVVGGKCQGNMTVSHQSDLVSEPIESTVLMLYSGDNERYCYSKKYDAASEGGTPDCMAHFTEQFEKVSASLLTTPTEDGDDNPNPFYDFFNDHDVSLWTVENGVARPLRLDVIYTFVNPAAPSFAKHMRARGLKVERSNRYNDWEELRFSLRTLYRNMLQSDALKQYARRWDADVAELERLGLRVEEEDDVRGVHVHPLVRRVHLVVSAEDQVPAWLDVAKFPGMRVVTHPEMFFENESYVLPTLNSNVIESGFHRIKNLSRFFTYFNNDMVIGRKVSAFDIFRPLSPGRQALHYLGMQLKSNSTGVASCVSPLRRESKRELLFLEAFQHSSTYYGYNWNTNKLVNRSAAMMEGRSQLRQCRYTEATRAYKLMSGTEHERLQALSAVKSLRSTKGFNSAFKSGIDYIGRGSGIGPEYDYSVVTATLEGFSPPFFMTHIPVTFDRDVYRDENEVQFAEMTRVQRGAYEREMSPFCQTGLYNAYAVTMARARERALWDEVLAHTDRLDLTFVSALRQYVSEHQKKKIHTPSAGTLAMDDVGSLYGSSQDVKLQAPDVLAHLGLWWMKKRTPPCSTIRGLKRVYKFPQVAIDPSLVCTLTKWQPLYDAHYLNLLEDMAHHLGDDDTYLFSMLFSATKVRMMIKKVHERRSLWMTFNDNFKAEMTDAEYGEMKALFKVLLFTASGYLPSGQWER